MSLQTSNRSPRDAFVRSQLAALLASCAALTLSAHAIAMDVDPPVRGATSVVEQQKELGSVVNDLLYTPIAPCRVLDTRSTAAGAINANGTRSFIVINASSFSSQGGSSTNCGTLGLTASAVNIAVTAITPALAGFATLYAFGTSQPVATSLSYAAGAIVTDNMTIRIPNPLSSFDFTIFTQQQSHFTVDILGYYGPPLPTALQCTDTALTIVTLAPGASNNVTAPACAAGYTATGTNCQTNNFLAPLAYASGGTCSAANNSAVTVELRAGRTCCRVPGR